MIESEALVEGESVHKGSFLFELFTKAGIIEDEKEKVLAIIEKVTTLLAEIQIDQDALSENAITIVADLFNRAFAITNENFNQVYRIHIGIENNASSKKDYKQNFSSKEGKLQ